MCVDYLAGVVDFVAGSTANDGYFAVAAAAVGDLVAIDECLATDVV